MKKKIGCFLFLLCCCGFCTAQQVVSSGGHSLKSGFNMDWSLGGNSIDISVVDPDDLDNFHKGRLMGVANPLKVYPNPATDFINIEISPVDTGRVNIELYNNSGVKVLSNAMTYQPVLKVNISEIPSGIYFLKVLLPSNNQLFEVEKIIKQ